MHLTHPAPVTGSQILGEVSFTLGAPAGGFAALACPRAEGPPDERPSSLEDDVQLSLLLFGGFRQSLP
jgi:hypothetical protein